MRSISQRELIKICHLYYIEGLTQQEISSTYGLSRFKISRLLKKARHDGLVTVQIKDPASDLTKTEIVLAKKYDLKQAIIVKTDEYHENTRTLKIGEAGAFYLSSIIHRSNILGVAWGRSVSYVVQNVKPVEAKHLIVVQMTGGMGAIEGTDATALTMALGQKLDAKAYVIQAPAIVRNRAIRNSFLKENQINEAISLAKKADSAIFGIGLPDEDGLLSRAGLLTQKNSEALKKVGAVGAICGRFFDIRGRQCAYDLDDHIIGLNLIELKKIKRKMAIAFGPKKVNAIFGALQGQLLDVLITDDKTASALIGIS